MKLALALLAHVVLFVFYAATSATALTRGTRDARFQIHPSVSTSTVPAAKGVAEEHEETIEERINSELTKTAEMAGRISDFPKNAAIFSEDMTRRFLPDLEFKPHIAQTACLFVSFAVLWFTLYFLCFYEDDRRPGFDRWRDRFDFNLISSRSDSGNTSGCNVELISPDIMIQFHHPCAARVDSNLSISKSAFDDVLVNDSQHVDDDHFHELKQLVPKSARSAAAGLSNVIVTLTRPLSGEPSQEVSAATYGTARTALLQDFCTLLPSLGFSVLLFSSIDDDELFMCVSLLDEEAINFYLNREQPNLQLRQGVISGLGIGQDINEKGSSPPFVPYDPTFVERLHDANIIEHDDAKEVYRTFVNRNGETLISSAVRAEYIHSEIQRYLNLDAAVRQNLILSWYPVHNAMRVHELWLSWANWHHAFDFSFVQPMQEIKAYFGSRVAFIFAWNGTYCKTLLSLSVLALTWEATAFLCSTIGIGSVSRKQIIGFSIILAIWSKWAACIWEREETFFLKDWGLEHTSSSSTNGAVRAEFFGEMDTSPFNSKVEELQYPKNKYFGRRLFANFVTLTYAVAVFVAYQVFMSLFGGKPLNTASCVVLSGMIKVFELIFAKLVAVLTDFENHKYHDDYYNSYLWKYFLVQFVNNYSAFFFFSISHEKLSANCEPVDPVHGGDCLSSFRRQLEVALLILTMCSVGGVFAGLILVKVPLAFELWQIKRSGKIPPPRGGAERQGKFNSFETREQIDTMLPIVVSLGHVLLFGAVAPVVIPFGFLNFLVQMRAAAYQQLYTFRRGFPHASPGIGSWKNIISFLRSAGVIYSGFLFVAYGESFEGCSVLSKLTGFLFFVTCVGILWTIVGQLLPKVDSVTQILEGRRDYVLRNLSKLGAEPNSYSQGLRRRASVVKRMDAVLEQRWNEIPQLYQMNDITETY